MSLLPKTLHARQGKRKRDRWGVCRSCGFPTAVRCYRCHSWRCRECIALRKAPGRIGVYLAVCSPRCLKRMAPEVAARVRASVRDGGSR
jgi:hypothetical protein